ncbi:DUF4013 domain-containing protein [Methanobacterium sp.]|uniref:DUF4013 domain-containing protein n=1 Tax=Methanobacterium sp. TaxID=2164 RepID=UPI002AB9E410|nr:DUF4013 domain-containing protein [Methanobacterium sp.]MDY9924040.1 DUF4013 domain-containing protein [Methanobacterium sp.]
MDMGEIIGDAFKYPVSNWKQLLILGVIVLISQFSMEIVMGYGRVSGLLYFLLIPALVASILILGYQLRTIRTSIMGENEPPEFNELTKLFLNGLRLFITSLVYGIIPTIVLVVGFIMLLVGSSGIGVIILLLGAILLIIVGIISVMAISNMAYYDEIGAAFRFGEIRERIESIGWLRYILMLILLGIFYIILAVVAALVTLIPFAGLVLVSLIIYPFMYLFMYRVYGLIFRETLDEEPEESLVQS